MQSIYVVTMWSGGRHAKQWKSKDKPEVLANGTGVRFRSADTRLMVEVIGSISVEEFESGREELEMGYGAGAAREHEPLIEEDGNGKKPVV